MDDDVTLELVEGEPFNITITVTGGVTLWPEREVYGQIRSGSNLVLELGPVMTVSASGPDLLIGIELNGAQTRQIAARGAARWDVFVSEPGGTQERASRVAQGVVTVDRSVTRAPWQVAT